MNRYNRYDKIVKGYQLGGNHMNISDARKLKPGNLVKQKQHGYVFSVVAIQECRTMTGTEYVKVLCRTNTGEIMKHNHKELLLLSKG